MTGYLPARLQRLYRIVERPVTRQTNEKNYTLADTLRIIHHSQKCKWVVVSGAAGTVTFSKPGFYEVFVTTPDFIRMGALTPFYLTFDDDCIWVMRFRNIAQRKYRQQAMSI